MAAPPHARALDPAEVPWPARAVPAALAAAGYDAFLVGGSVRDLLRGAPRRDFDVATSAPPDAVLDLFPRAVPIGLRHGTVMVPTAAGPVDVTTFRAWPRIEDDLAHRDFTVNAIAWDPASGALLDPFDGRGDLRQGRLRAVRSADARFAEDPLRALRAARLVATLGLAPDAEVEAAMARAAGPLAGLPRERVRQELAALLVGERAGDALELLRRTGLEAALLPHPAPDAPRVVDAVPAEVEIRLAAWLRGSHAAPTLPRLRFARPVVRRVDRLLRMHPVEAGADPKRDASVRHLLRRAGERDLAALFALREAELRVGDAARRPGADAAREALATLRAAAERVRSQGRLALRRRDLALDGRDVQKVLGCRPGPAVGRALAWLTERVLEDPAQNTPERLRALLEEWDGAAPAAAEER